MPQPYLDYVRRISREWSHLQVLVEFCNPKLKFGQQGGLVVAQRMEKIDVQVIDANTSADGIFSFQKAQHLKCWNDLQTWKKDFFQKPASQDCKHQVLIVEEISVALIEFLGHSFSLDPNFFLEHIQEMCRFGRGKSQLQWTGSHKAVVFPLNPYSDIQSQQFATLRYPRPYYIRSLHEVDAQRLRRNVPRLAWCTGEDTYSNEALSLYSGIECGQGLLSIVICDSLLNSGNPSSVHLPDARPIPNYALSTNIEGHFDIDERKKSHSARDIFVSGLCSRCFSGPGDEQHPMTASSMLMAEAVAMALSFHRTSVPAVMRFPYTGVLDIYTPGIDAHSAFGTSSVREAQRALHRRRRFIQKALFELDELGTVIEYQLHPQMKISCSLQQQNLMRQLSTIKDEYEAHLTYLNQDTMAKQTETLSRVTKLGFLLLPFTTVSGLLSIQESYRYLILIPLVALLMVILILLGIRGLEIRDIQERTMSWFRHDLGLILKGLAGRFWRPKKEGAQTA